MMRPALLLLLACCLAANAEPRVCGNGLVTIEGTGQPSDLMCESADRAVTELAACNLPLTWPVRIRSVNSIASGDCVGVFHCDEALIEVVSPEALKFASSGSGLFDRLPPETHFQSVVFHELTHAAYHGTPCPFGDLYRATSEYLAYSLQICSLTDADRAKINLSELLGREVHSDEINALILFIAPDTFAAKAWAHLMQQPVPCDFVARFASGEIFFDYLPP